MWVLGSEISASKKALQKNEILKAPLLSNMCSAYCYCTEHVVRKSRAGRNEYHDNYQDLFSITIYITISPVCEIMGHVVQYVNHNEPTGYLLSVM